jgi:hypothetical protein
MNARFLFTHTDQPPGGIVIRRQMCVGQASDRVPKGIIDIPRRPIAAMDVSDHTPAHSTGRRRGEGLDAITENHNDLTLETCQCFADPTYTASHCRGFRLAVITPGLHSHLGIDSPARLPDLIHRLTEPPQQVHARHDQPHVQLTALDRSPQHGFKQAELRACPRHDGDATAFSGTAAAHDSGDRS